MPFDYSFKKIGLIIIDSLAPNDFQSGEKLFEDLKLKTYLNNSFLVYFKKINSLETFDDALNCTKNLILERSIFPFIHFEAHGNDIGMKVNTDQRIKWEYLLSRLRELNVLLMNNLIVSMSMCKGASLIYKIDYHNRAPFNVVIGPDFSLKAGDLYEGFYSFYDSFFFDYDFNKSFEIMSMNIGKMNDALTMITSSSCFDIYTAIDENSEYFEYILEPYRLDTIKLVPEFEILPIRKQYEYVWSKLKIIIENLKGQKNYFLMLDL
jgi:hypothetical protein